MERGGGGASGGRRRAVASPKLVSVFSVHHAPLPGRIAGGRGRGHWLYSLILIKKMVSVPALLRHNSLSIQLAHLSPQCYGFQIVHRVTQP